MPEPAVRGSVELKQQMNVLSKQLGYVRTLSYLSVYSLSKRKFRELSFVLESSSTRTARLGQRKADHKVWSA